MPRRPQCQELKSDEVRSRILETEIRRREGSSNAAYSLTTQKVSKGKKTATTDASASLSAINLKTTECFYCHKMGHMAPECNKKARDKKKKKKQKEKSSSGEAKSSKASTSALNAVASDDEFDACLSAYFGAPENWLVDSGATNHMTPFGNDITDYVTFAEGSRTVVLGNSSTRCNILGKGNVTRWVETSPKKYTKIVLRDVLHVNGIQRRFLSTIKFQDRDYVISLDKKRAVFSKDNKRLFSAPRHGPIIELILYSEPPLKPYQGAQLHAITELPAKLWHERMGHLNWDSLKKTQSESTSSVIGIHFDDSDIPHTTCEGCQAGKAKRRSFKSSTSGTRATLPIERIHSDLMGPMDPKSVNGGYEYACVFTCCYSRHVWVYLLKAKSHTFEVFKKFRTMVELQLGRRIKLFRSDRGGEFMSAEFTKYLEENGIVHETSAPRTPQQNGVAERMNQTLLGGACAMLHHAGITGGDGAFTQWVHCEFIVSSESIRPPQYPLGTMGSTFKKYPPIRPSNTHQAPW
jgi:hypothetical protein